MKATLFNLFLILGLLGGLMASQPLFSLDRTEKIQNRLEKEEALTQRRIEKKRTALEKKYQKKMNKLETWHKRELKQLDYEERIMKEKLNKKKEKLNQP